jgi:hypothetical protein
MDCWTPSCRQPRPANPPVPWKPLASDDQGLLLVRPNAPRSHPAAVQNARSSVNGRLIRRPVRDWVVLVNVAIVWGNCISMRFLFDNPLMTIIYTVIATEQPKGSTPMQHIEKSAFRRGEYTALAGTAATLTRFKIIRRNGTWVATPAAWTPGALPEMRDRTLASLDSRMADLSR